MVINMKEIKERICQDIKNLWPAAVTIVFVMIMMNVVFHAFCPMVVLTGLPCPGCGMTRSLFYLLTGRIGRSVWMHPMGIPAAGIMLYYLWNRYIGGKRAKGMKFLIAISIFLLVILYFVRMYCFFPDREPYVYMKDNILAQILPFYEQTLHALNIL
ncbi:MAG: DUF2752 domain-containing protein [Lachnospiraceae bacterium]|nr:DUF2752 domain-containing protein [Lachnospiraceae bacterium]